MPRVPGRRGKTFEMTTVLRRSISPRIRYRTVAVAVVLGLALSATEYGGYPLLLQGLGSYLVVDGSLEKASAIAVMGGDIPFRAMEAAELYKAKWAPKIILARGKRGEDYYALRSLGIDIREGGDYNREILIRLGVPGDAIILLDDEVENTVQEIASILTLLHAQGWGSVILVTSKIHSRRTAAIWHHVSRGQLKAITRGARTDPFVMDGWWKIRGHAFGVLREYLGLLNLWLGLPMG